MAEKTSPPPAAGEPAESAVTAQSPQCAAGTDKAGLYAQGGLVLLILPVMLLAGGLGLYVFWKSDAILDNVNQVRQAEEAAAAQAEQARLDREAQLIAEFEDAFSREDLIAAAAVVQRMEVENVAADRVKSCREGLEKARAQAANESAKLPVGPPDPAP